MVVQNQIKMTSTTIFIFVIISISFNIDGCWNKDPNVVLASGSDNNNHNKDAILVPIVEAIKSPQIHPEDHHHSTKLNPREQAILLRKYHDHLLPHKIIIEEEEEDEIEPLPLPPSLRPVAIIKEKESFIQEPDIDPHYHHHVHHPVPTGLDHQPGSPILVHLVTPNVRRKQDSSIPDLLAVLAPLAAIPLIGSLAVSSFTTMLTLTGLGRRRRRKRDLGLHDKVLNFLNSSGQTFDSYGQPPPRNSGSYFGQNGDNFRNFTTTNRDHEDHNGNNQTMVPISELFQLDIVQQYLRQSGRPDHNDEIIASYLACRGMFQNDNNCLERLACHYADMQNGRLRPLERDVAALIIYSLLRNSHIDGVFKRRLQRAALFGYDHSSGEQESRTSNEPSFVAACDREFPCPRSEVP